MIKKGDMVKSYHGYIGIVQTEFENWDDLKSKNDFLTIGDDNKDLWLMEQENQYTVEQLYEKWFSIRCIEGGAIWSCESKLEILNQN
jgi:hypothetical protein